MLCESKEMTFPLKLCHVTYHAIWDNYDAFTSSELYFYNIVAKHWSISTAESSTPDFVRAPLLSLCGFCGCQTYF